jgi:hypothetical protein
MRVDKHHGAHERGAAPEVESGDESLMSEHVWKNTFENFNSCHSVKMETLPFPSNTNTYSTFVPNDSSYKICPFLQPNPCQNPPNNY